MNSFATIDRFYPASGGNMPSRREPDATKQANGFRPSYYDINGDFVPGDSVDPAELNFIFNDLYAQAANIDALLTAQGL